MHSDESTLPEPIEDALLRAGFAHGADGVDVIRSSLSSPVARQRVLALRAGARRSLVSDEEWTRALGDEQADDIRCDRQEEAPEDLGPPPERGAPAAAPGRLARPPGEVPVATARGARWTLPATPPASTPAPR